MVLAAFTVGSKEVQAFRQGLREAGYEEGRDLVIEWRSASGQYERLPEFVGDLVQRKVEVIVVDGTPATQVAKRTTSSIPIVMAFVADPVGSGLVPNLAHPGGNVTGLSMMTPDLAAKRLQLLKDAIPRLSRVAVLTNTANPFHAKVVEELKAAGASMSLEVGVVGVRTTDELGPALASASRAQALYVVEDALFFVQRTTLLKQAMKSGLPVIYGGREFAEAGALMSYGANLGDLYRRSAGYVDKILKGAKPGDLPIEQPAKFDFVINLRTAKALGVGIPQALLLSADEVLQ